MEILIHDQIDDLLGFFQFSCPYRADQALLGVQRVVIRCVDDSGFAVPHRLF